MDLYYIDTNKDKEKNVLMFFFVIAYVFSWSFYYLDIWIDSSSDVLNFVLETLVKFGFSLSGFLMAFYVGENLQSGT